MCLHKPMSDHWRNKYVTYIFVCGLLEFDCGTLRGFIDFPAWNVQSLTSSKLVYQGSSYPAAENLHNNHAVVEAKSSGLNVDCQVLEWKKHSQKEMWAAQFCPSGEETNNNISEGGNKK